MSTPYVGFGNDTLRELPPGGQGHFDPLPQVRRRASVRRRIEGDVQFLYMLCA